MEHYPLNDNSSAYTHFGEAAASVMDLVYHMFGLRTAFVARTTPEHFMAVAVQDQGGCRLEEGTTLPLEESY